MPMTIVCPFCAHAYELADDYPHFTVQCPRCKAVYLFERPEGARQNDKGGDQDTAATD